MMETVFDELEEQMCVDVTEELRKGMRQSERIISDSAAVTI